MPAAAKTLEKPKPAAAASGELTNGKGSNKNASSSNPTTANGTSNNSAPSLGPQDPQKIVNTIIEKKVRNLEKRKVRLLEIKALEDKGQQLEADQKVAVKKLDSVIEMIDLLKDIGKNVTDGLTEYSKQLKKQQKREVAEKQAERQQQEIERVKLWLNAQFILARFNSAKNDLLQGENGAMKLEKSQVDALEKLVELLAPQSFEVIESSAEKVNFLLEGNKREFSTGVSYSVLKETIVKLIESKYFENVAPTVVAKTTTTTSTSTVSSNDKEETVPTVNEPVSVTEQMQPSLEKPEPTVEAKPQVVQQQPNNVHQLSQLCFMRDNAENDLNKDPAVVAIGQSGFPYQPQIGQVLPASSGANIPASSTISNHYSPHMYPPHAPVSLATIPTQTFTNPSYTALIPGANQYIPMPGQIPHPQHMQIPVQTSSLPPPLRNVGPDVSPILPVNEKNIEQQHQQAATTGDKQVQQFSPESGNPKDASNLQPSQEGGADGKQVNGQLANGETGGHYKRNNRGGGPRGGGPRGGGGNYGGNSNGAYRGGPRGGGKSYGGGNASYFNAGNVPNASGNFNNNNGGANRPTGNRSGPSGNRSGAYRGGAPRNNNNTHFTNTNNNQAAPVPAK